MWSVSNATTSRQTNRPDAALILVHLRTKLLKLRNTRRTLYATSVSSSVLLQDPCERAHERLVLHEMLQVSDPSA